jgi:hypothetical protein
MSSEQKTRILRVISREPKTFKHFTDGHHGVGPFHMRRWVKELSDAGFLVHGHDDTLTITEEGRAHLEQPTSVAQHRVYCNAAMPVLQPKPWISPRAGADDHKRFKSLTA